MNIDQKWNRYRPDIFSKSIRPSRVCVCGGCNSHANSWNEPKSNLSEIRFYACPCYLQFWWRFNQNLKSLSSDLHFLHYMSMGFLVAVETKVLTRSAPKPNTANLSPHWRYLWNLINISQLTLEVCLFESMDARTHTRTDDGALLYYKVTFWVFGSDKLKCRMLQLWLAHQCQYTVK